MNLPTLGIDPGQVGGAVLLEPDGRTVAMVWSWTRRAKGGVYTLDQQAGPERYHRFDNLAPERHTVASLADVGQVIAATIGPEGCTLTVESYFIPRRKKGERIAAYEGRLRHLLQLAEATGQLMAPLLHLAHGDVLRPTAAVWRPLVLGCPPNPPTDAAKSLAIAAVTRARPPLVEGIGALGRVSHVAESACIGRYGALTRSGS